MEQGHEKAGILPPQDPGRGNRHRTAASRENIAQSHVLINQVGQALRARNTASGIPYRVGPIIGEPLSIEDKSRGAWAVAQLREAAETGCTPIANLSLRWNACVHELRQLGVEVETIGEVHGAPFVSHHGRHILRSTVRRAAR